MKKKLTPILVGAALLMAARLLAEAAFWPSLALDIAAYLVVGRQVVCKAARNICHGEVFDENLLMVLATVGAFAVRQFPEAVAVMLFYQVGEMFQDYAVDKSRRSISALMDIRPDHATLLHDDGSAEEVALRAAADMGQLLLDGLADGVWVNAPQISEEELHNIELIILQAARARFSHTEYIACPSCGRTLYNIEQALADIKARTSHLKGLKIGVMGCIVNGPGEMADADYGYVGAGAGRISLYKGKECIERNIPQEEALEHLIALIKANGDWKERD